jgi:hypothetical protein
MRLGEAQVGALRRWKHIHPGAAMLQVRPPWAVNSNTFAMTSRGSSV